jgi:hypothetical protein
MRTYDVGMVRLLALAALVACKPARSCAVSPCIAAAPISVRHGVVAWDDTLRGDTIECRWVTEISNVLLCGARDLSVLNSSLTRASIFIEGPGVYVGTIVARDSPIFVEQRAHVRGFDLLERHPGGHHPDLLGFYAALDAACAKDHALCADATEQAMRDLLEHAWAGRSQLVLVTFGGEGYLGDDIVISHEMLHAQYFTDPAYRDAIDAYWRELSEGAREIARTSLGQAYARDDDELISNELQAYVLMSGAEATTFAGLVTPHRAALLARLRARTIEPIQTELRAPRD